MNLIKPPVLMKGDTIGIFTPSQPSYIINEEMLTNGIKNIENLGFKVVLGSLTHKRASQGYRSGTPKDRAKEFMDLYSNSHIKGLISTIGGSNSSSLIPFLDFEFIRNNPKIICGYSDVTSLHLAFLHYSNLSTIYGTAAMPWFGEWPSGDEFTINSFLDATMMHTSGTRKIKAPPKWSNHFRDWGDGSWKTVEREWLDNAGWKVLNPGLVKGALVIANLNTLTRACPQFKPVF